MEERERPGPSWYVEVTIAVGTPTYGNLASQIYGWENRVWWESLGDLLGGRPGWHCEFDGSELLWSFGPGGSSLFNVSAPADVEDYHMAVYRLFDYEADITHRFVGTTDLLDWLEENEARHRDHLLNLRGLASANDWAVLKAMGIDVRVTHDGRFFIATFPTIPFESAADQSLPNLLAQAREAIARAHGAPSGMAHQIKVHARLDAAATGALQD